MTSRIQSDAVIVQRRSEAPRSFLNRQRRLLGSPVVPVSQKDTKSKSQLKQEADCSRIDDSTICKGKRGHQRGAGRSQLVERGPRLVNARPVGSTIDLVLICVVRYPKHWNGVCWISRSPEADPLRSMYVHSWVVLEHRSCLIPNHSTTYSMTVHHKRGTHGHLCLSI